MPCSLRAHFGSLKVCVLGLSDTHEKHTSSTSASHPLTHTLPYVPTYGLGAYRTGPCRIVSDLTVPSRTLPHRTGPFRARTALDRTHLSLPYIPASAAPYCIHVADWTVPRCILHTVPFRTLISHTLPYVHIYGNGPCHPVPYRTGPGRFVPAPHWTVPT